MAVQTAHPQHLHGQPLANDVERVLLRSDDEQHSDAEADECVGEIRRLVLHLDRVNDWRQQDDIPTTNKVRITNHENKKKCKT